MKPGKLAWPVQIAVFALLVLFLPRTSYRIFILLGYILVSTPLAGYIKRTYS